MRMFGLKIVEKSRKVGWSFGLEGHRDVAFSVGLFVGGDATSQWTILPLS